VQIQLISSNGIQRQLRMQGELDQARAREQG